MARLPQMPSKAPSFPGASPAEVQLCIMVAPSVRRRVREAAEARGLTLRALVLSALCDASVLERDTDLDLTDRRAALGPAKTRNWRERTAAAATQAAAAPGPPGHTRRP